MGINKLTVHVGIGNGHIYISIFLALIKKIFIMCVQLRTAVDILRSSFAVLLITNSFSSYASCSKST